MCDNRAYVLFEFINEDKKDGDDFDRPVQIGFSEWLLCFEDEVNVNIHDLIENETKVRTKWPTNYDVKPKESFKKLNNVQWKEVVAVVKAQSDDWREIKEASKNLIQFGVPFPTRKQRKELAKVKSSQQISDKNNTKKKQGKRKAIKGSSEKTKKPRVLYGSAEILSAAKSRFNNNNYIESSSCDESSPKEESIKTKKENINPVSHTKKLKVGASYDKKTLSDSSDSDEWSSADSKDESLNSVKVKHLQEKINQLQKELMLYKSMKCLVDEFPTVLNKLKKLSKRVKCNCSNDVTKYQSSIKTDEVCELDVSSVNVLIKNEVKSDWNKHELTLESEEHVKTVNFQLEQNANDADFSEINKTSSILEVHHDMNTKESSPFSTANNTQKESNAVVWFGSKSLSKEFVMKARHTKIGILASELTAMVFSSEDMALCTMKGKQNNQHKLSFKKKILDEDRVNGIIEYVAKHFHKTKQEVEQDVKKAIRFKLNNFTKTAEGKKNYRSTPKHWYNFLNYLFLHRNRK